MEKLNYRELQRRAREVGVKANLKRIRLAELVVDPSKAAPSELKRSSTTTLKKTTGHSNKRARPANRKTLVRVENSLSAVFRRASRTPAKCFSFAAHSDAASTPRSPGVAEKMDALRRRSRDSP